MNSVNIVGILTKPPECKTTDENISITRFTVSIDRVSGEDKKNKSDFLRVVAIGKLADDCKKYLQKGSSVAVSGRLESSIYEDKNGTTHYPIDINAIYVKFLDKKRN